MSKHKRSNGKPGQLLGPAQSLQAYKLSVAMPFELLSYRVRFRDIVHVDTDKGNEERNLIQVQVYDHPTGVEAQLVIPEVKILLAKDLTPIIHESVKKLRKAIMDAHFMITKTARKWVRFKARMDKRRGRTPRAQGEIRPKPKPKAQSRIIRPGE